MIPDENSWHLAEGQLADYARGRSTVAQAASVETHMTACAHCRSRLAEMLPELPVERMWQHILSATDPAPPRQRHQATRRTRLRSWMAFSPAPVSGPRRVGIAVLALLLFLPLVVHVTYPRDDNRSVSAVTQGKDPARATSVPGPEALQKGGRTIRLGRKEAVNPSIPVAPPTSHAPQGPRSLPPQLRSQGTAEYEPRDRIPWRSGRHPD
jgi:anti-sigma factor RsiW